MLFPWMPEWVDLNIAVPICATVVVVVVGVVVICVALSRRTLTSTQTRLRSDCMSFVFDFGLLSVVLKSVIIGNLSIAYC